MRARLLPLFILVLFAWSSPSKLEIDAIRHQAACQVAEIVVIDWPKYHGDITYRFSLGATSPDDEIGSRNGLSDYDIRDNRTSPEWPKALMRQLPQTYFDEFRFQRASRPFVQCPNLSKVALSRGHEVSNGPKPLAYPFGSLVIYDKPFVAFSLPYLSQDGRDALFLYHMSGSNDSGHSSVVLYRKNDLGVWEMVDEIGVSIS
jgi:hypothetical protein